MAQRGASAFSVQPALGEFRIDFDAGALRIRQGVQSKQLSTGIETLSIAAAPVADDGELILHSV